MPSAAPPIEIERPRPERTDKPSSGGGGFRPGPPLGYGGGGDGAGGENYRAGERLKMAVWIGIAGIVMFFAAISSAMVVRRVGEDWKSLEMPDALWVSTSLLLASSIAFEIGRRQLKRGTLGKLRFWMAVTVALGLGFLVAQLVGWSQLADRGIFVASGPSSSFFYLLTGAHGAHVLGGLVALAAVAWKTLGSRPSPMRAAIFQASALYWHFMDGLWLYLLGLLFFL